MKRKIIFLDIDGCMCPFNKYCEQDNEGHIKYIWNEEAVNVIISFVKKFKYEIVISSDWKECPQTLFEYLEKWKLKKYLHEHWQTDNIDNKRDLQIERWINKHEKDLDNYIIIDDMSCFTDEEEKHHIKPNGLIGLKYTHWFAMEEINKKDI